MTNNPALPGDRVKVVRPIEEMVIFDNLPPELRFAIAESDVMIIPSSVLEATFLHSSEAIIAYIDRINIEAHAKAAKAEVATAFRKGAGYQRLPRPRVDLPSAGLLLSERLPEACAL